MRLFFATAALCLLAASAARAEEKIVRLDDPAIAVEGSLWKNMDVRFSESFAKDRLTSPDQDKMAVSELPPGKICFQDGSEDGIDLEVPAMKEFARADKGDFCVNRADVSVRYTPITVAGAPPSPPYYIDKSACQWTWKQGKGIGIWYEDCNYGDDPWTVAYDDAVDGFVAKTASGESEPFGMMLQFRKAGGPEALLPDLKKAGKVLDTPDCEFQPVKDSMIQLTAGWTAWEVAPTGKLKETFDATPEGDMPEPPCGDLGQAVDYIGFFLVHKDHPDRILWVDLGQDVSPIDLPSITFTP